MSNGNGEPAWADLIKAASAGRVVERTAKRFDGGIVTASRPQKFICDDDQLYAIKFAQNNHGDGAAIFTEQVVGRIGALLEAAVAPVELVDVSDDLAAVAHQESSPDFVPQGGVHHGSLWAMDYSGPAGPDHVDANLDRFAMLEVLYTWFLCGSDHQFLYQDQEPRHVLSVDHSPFLPNGPNWTAEGLRDPTASLQRDTVLAGLALSSENHAEPITRLRAVTVADIANAVAMPPDEWGVDLSAREAVASYLWIRREPTIQLFSPEEES